METSVQCWYIPPPSYRRFYRVFATNKWFIYLWFIYFITILPPTFAVLLLLYVCYKIPVKSILIAGC
ncbi:hypothetical protein XENTR_v10017968 [Xenopus tropicalis]|nr:hypothetical protein XENTR_v10017968 [Xenopus tropicalis]